MKKEVRDEIANNIESSWNMYNKIDCNTDGIKERMARYSKLINDVPMRIEQVVKIYTGKKFSRFNVEICALHLRKICEILVVGAVILNGELYQKYFDN